MSFNEDRARTETPSTVSKASHDVLAVVGAFPGFETVSRTRLIAIPAASEFDTTFCGVRMNSLIFCFLAECSSLHQKFRVDIAAFRWNGQLQKFGLALSLLHLLILFPCCVSCLFAAFLRDSAGHIVIVC